MRGLKRNEQTIYYANLDSTVTDEWGNSAKAYGAPQPIKVCVSVEKGETVPSGYGDSLNYIREIVTHDMNCPITESSHLWVDISTDEPYNYKVKRVSHSLNCVVCALERVEVS